MSERVVVLGAGYAGAVAVQRLQRGRPAVDLTWVSREDHHLVLHESHRVVRDPGVAADVTIPVDSIAGPDTTFVQGEVTGVDTAARIVELADGTELDYDYAVVALGTCTAFYGIPGLAEHAHTLKSLADARAIHGAVVEAAATATQDDPARVVVGGGGISGVQVAGEVAAFRDETDAPLEVTLVEAMPEILPGQDPSLRRAVRERVDESSIKVLADDPVVEATPDGVVFDGRDPLDYDVLVWTGGITGRRALESAAVDKHHERLETGDDLRTSDDRVFAVGDSALVDQAESVAPPTAEAAWSAAAVAAGNVRRAIQGNPLETWTLTEKGTLVSIGEAAVAHDLIGVPIQTFGGRPAQVMKKLVAARWIATVSSWRRALGAWSSL